MRTIFAFDFRRGSRGGWILRARHVVEGASMGFDMPRMGSPGSILTTQPWVDREIADLLTALGRKERWPTERVVVVYISRKEEESRVCRVYTDGGKRAR